MSFSEIYRQHADAVFRLAGSGRIEQATVRSFLYAIVRNLVISQQRRPAVELAVDDEQLSDAIEPDPGSS